MNQVTNNLVDDLALSVLSENSRDVERRLKGWAEHYESKGLDKPEYTENRMSDTQDQPEETVTDSLLELLMDTWWILAVLGLIVADFVFWIFS